MHHAQLTEDFQETDARSKPKGGYVQLSANTLALLWWGYSQSKLSLRAVRVGLALYELRIRRRAYVWSERKQGRAPELTPNYSAKELATLCGLPPKRAKAALDELSALGLLAQFSPEGFAFASSFEELELSPEELRSFRSWSQALTTRKRVPFPRRILVLACESPSPALVAVILGVCLRCAWLKPGVGCSYSGRVSCQWLSRLFGLSLRAVQSAKSHLVGLEWIHPAGDINRFGERLEINPAWERLVSLKAQSKGRGESTGTKSAPPPQPPGTNPAGVSLIRESLPPEESKDQENLPPGGRNSGPGFYKPHLDCDPTPPKPDPAARLSNIHPEDLADTGRALELFRQAVKCGLMPDGGEHSRLLWMAAIERARTVTARNPAGVFLTLVKRRLWRFLSDGQFDAANRRIKEHLFSGGAEMPPLFEPAPMAGPPKRAMLSKDALLVQVLRNKLGRRGEDGVLFHALKAHAGFDRERFDAALAELAPR